MKRSKFFQRTFNPLTSARHFTYVCFWEFLANLILDRYLCKFYTGEPCPSAVCSRKQNQFIIYATHFRFVYISKIRFLAKKAVHFFGALLNKRKRFSLFILNGYRYLKISTVSAFRNKGLKNQKFSKKLMKNKFTLLQIRKNYL